MQADTTTTTTDRCDDEDGSLVAEYGLVAIIGATIASLAIKWATGGAIWELFGMVSDRISVLMGG